MRRLVLLVCLAGCATSPGQDPLRPQPEPEQARNPTLDPGLVRFHREGGQLVISGAAGAVDGADEQLVVTELRHDAPVVETAVTADRGFVVALDTTGATDVQLTPVVEGYVGFSTVFHVDANAQAIQASAGCLGGAVGLWSLGDVAEGDGTLAQPVHLVNGCDVPIALDAVALRIGASYTITVPSLPRTLAPMDEIEIPVAFTLPANEPRSGAPIYDFLELRTTPSEGAGFVLRVTRFGH